MWSRFAAAIVAVLLFAGACTAETWRLAGTFNGWNAGDDSWAMSGLHDGSFRIEAPLESGSYRFKFVKDGRWEAGHLGGAGAANTLEMPGTDIVLKIRAAGVYRIDLRPVQKEWSLSPVRIDKASFDVRLRGTPMVNRGFVLDFSNCLTIEPLHISRISIDSDHPSLRTRKFQDDGRMLEVMPDRQGPMSLTVEIEDRDETFSRTFQLDVLPEAYVQYISPADNTQLTTIRFEEQGNGVLRALLGFAAQTTLQTIVAFPGPGPAVEVQNASIPAGVYVVEVRNGEVLTHDDKRYPSILHPGNWRRFAHTPTWSADSVHLIAEFNDWARPGRPGAIELRQRTDGVFTALVDVPRGAHRYRYLLDGVDEILDPANSRSEMGFGGRGSVVVSGPTPAEFGAPPAGAIMPEAVFHDPASRNNVRPISSKLGLADISLLTLPNDAQAVSLEVELPGPKGRAVASVPMTRESDLSGFDRWTARVMTGAPEAIYSFKLTDGEGQFTTRGYSARIQPVLEHPAWAMGAVWYQIFPERFRNGNPLNDPHGPGVYQMPWTDDWYTISPEEDARWRTAYNVPKGAPYPPRKGGNLFHVVWDRRFGGDLQGIAEKFDYLKELGVTALYMNPIFEAESMHKYDATDYRHIDDNFALPKSAGKVPERYSFEGEPPDPKTWSWSPSDRYFVEEFIPAARKAGIKVVLDGVFNHTGKPFFAFQDIEKNGVNSPYKDWFYVTFDEQGKLKDWVSWFNTGALPKFKQTTTGDLVPPVKEHIFNVTRRWMDPNGDGNPSDGIDGWRLDVALDVGLPFWRDWRSLVKSINPDAIIIAEIWDDASPHLTGDTFDTQMNYPFCKPLLDWLGVRPGYTSQQLSSALRAAFDDAPQTNLIHQNLFGSHDTDRYVSMLLNPGREYDQGNRPQDHDFPYKDVRPTTEIYKLSLLGVAAQALYTGSPMVYYGDEVGMWGADDPTDRKPFPWPDKGTMKNPDEAPDWKLHEQYTTWLNLRNDPEIGPLLRFGSTRHLDTGAPGVFAFERSLNDRRLIAVINRENTAFDAGELLPRGARDPRVGAVSAKYWILRP